MKAYTDLLRGCRVYIFQTFYTFLNFTASSFLLLTCNIIFNGLLYVEHNVNVKISIFTVKVILLQLCVNCLLLLSPILAAGTKHRFVCFGILFNTTC